MSSPGQHPFREELKRCLLLGGAIGVLGGIFFMDIRRGLVLGLLGGFLAVITRRLLDNWRRR